MLRKGKIPLSIGASDGTQRGPSDTNRRSWELVSEPSPRARWIDRALFIAWALVTYVLTFALSHSDDDVPTSNSVAAAAWGLAYLVAIAVIVVDRRTAIRLARGALPLVAIIVLAGLSTVWSVSPEATVTKSLALLGSTLVALALVCRLGLKGFVQALGLLFVFLALLNAALIAAAPSYSLKADGAWQGFFTTKSELGLTMVFGILTVICMGDTRRRIHQTAQIAAITLSFILVIGSRSVTSLLVAVALALIVPLAFWMRERQSSRTGLLRALVLSATACTAMMCSIDAKAVLDALGRDDTLTGRGTIIWPGVIDAIRDRPLLGYGHAAFWSPEGPSTQYVGSRAWMPGIAHNGFLEVALHTGMAGEAALVFFLLIGLLRGAALFWRGRDRLSAWPFLAMVYAILANLTETSFERGNEFHWVALVAAFLFSTDAWQRRVNRERTTIPACKSSLRSSSKTSASRVCGSASSCRLE